MLSVQAKILHISDLHFGKRIGQDLKDRLCQIVHQTAPDLIIVTGDVANHPIPWLMKSAATFLDTMCKQCPEKPPHVLVFPGNHDYKFWGNVGFRRLTRIPFHVYFRHSGLSLQWPTRLKLYLRLIQNSLIPRGRELWDNLKVSHFPDLGITVFPFNSNPLAEMSAAGKVDPANLIELDQHLTDWDHETPPSDQYKIAVLHHHAAPIAYVSTDLKARVQESLMILYNAGTFLRMLNEKSFDLVLHGHRHFASFLRIGHDFCVGKTRHLALAGAGSALHPKPDDYRGNHLNFIELFDDDTARLHSWFFSSEVRRKDESHYYELRDLLGVRDRRQELLRKRAGLTIFEQRRDAIITVNGYTVIKEQFVKCRGLNEDGTSRFNLLLEVSAPCYLRGMGILSLPNSPVQQRLKTAATSLRTFKGEIDFGQPFKPSDAPFDFGYTWRLMNGHALKRQEFQRRYVDTAEPVKWEYASVMCQASCDILTLRVHFPENFDMSTLKVDAEVLYAVPPLVDMLCYRAGKFKFEDHPTESGRVRGCLRRDGNIVTLQCCGPIPGFLYRIRWSFAEDVGTGSVGLAWQAYVSAGKERLLAIARREVPNHEAMYEKMREVLAMLANDLMQKLREGGAAAGRAEDLDVSLMVFDEAESRIRFVCATFGDIAELVGESFVSGEGCAGFAFEKARPVLYHPKRDRVGYYIHPEERAEDGQPTRLIRAECLLTFPWIHPSGIIVGVVNVGTQNLYSPLLHLFDLDPEKQRQQIQTLQALTCVAGNGILEMAVGA